MVQKSFFSLRALCAAAICISMISTGCTNDDKNPPSAVSDTSTVVAPDNMGHDTGANVTQATDTAKMGMSNTKMGMAKPNPAKKGMKGKVTVMPAPKMSGNMEADNTGTYSNVEVYPSFPGGNKGLQDYFDKNLSYPSDAVNDGVEGVVNVMFTVDETGKLTDPHIMGDKLGYGLDEEALKVVRSMPAWQPGKLKGKNVKTKFTLPVSFQLY